MGGKFVLLSVGFEPMTSQIAKFVGPTWGPPGSCRHQMGTMLANEPCYQGSYSSSGTNQQQFIDQRGTSCLCDLFHVPTTPPTCSFVINRNNLFNTLRPKQNGRHFADDTFNRIFVNENVRISIKFWLKFVPKRPINTIPALVQIVAWRRPGDKSLFEPMLVS